MAFYDMPHTANTDRLRRMLSQLTTDLLAWREERTTRNTLGKLTDRELSDIGLLRGDLEQMSEAGQRNA